MHMERRSFLQAVLSAPAISAAWREGPPRAFETELAQMMSVAPVPGLVIGTLAQGKPTWIRAFGVRSADEKQPVTSDTIFQAASLSKQVTAYAAFALRDKGKLDFDTPVVSYVDDLEDARARLITIRNILSHTTGFPNWRSETGQKLVPDFQPGEKFQYSGEGFFYLQRVLEQVTGKGFCEIIDELVFQPLDMTSSSMIWKPEMSARFAVPHDRRGAIRKNWDAKFTAVHDIAARTGKPVTSWKYADYEAAARESKSPPLPNWMLPNAAASMVTSAPDYAKFLSAAIRNPDIRKEQIKIRASFGWGLGWGLGWGIERAAGHEYVWQWGDNGGYKNFVAADAATGAAIFVFTNGDSGERVYDRIVTHATGHDHPAFFWL
jgi:CubicO group peptidase (beta-lactamase class C family)